MDKEFMNIGERVIKLRKSSHLTQHQLGVIVGLHGSNISRIEKGLSEPSATVLKRMADYFHVTSDFILGRVSNDIQTAEFENREFLSLYKKLDSYNREELLEIMKLKYKMQS